MLQYSSSDRRLLRSVSILIGRYTDQLFYSDEISEVQCSADTLLGGYSAILTHGYRCTMLGRPVDILIRHYKAFALSGYNAILTYWFKVAKRHSSIDEMLCCSNDMPHDMKAIWSINW